MDLLLEIVMLNLVQNVKLLWVSERMRPGKIYDVARQACKVRYAEGLFCDPIGLDNKQPVGWHRIEYRCIVSPPVGEITIELI